MTGRDHCSTHDDGHAHLCFAHLPAHGPSGVAWLVLAVIGAWFGAKATEGMAELVHARRLVRGLLRASTTAPSGALQVPSSRPLCVSVGLLSPRVVVSDGFLARARPEHVRAALAHEGAHVERRDALVRLSARAASVLYPPRMRGALLAELDVAAERACDERAATVVGDRLTVAETILSVERMLQAGAELHGLPAVRAIAAEAVARRVEALLEPAETGGTPRTVLAGLVALTLLLFVASQPLHHGAESVLALALHGSR